MGSVFNIVASTNPIRSGIYLKILRISAFAIKRFLGGNAPARELRAFLSEKVASILNGKKLELNKPSRIRLGHK